MFSSTLIRPASSVSHWTCSGAFGGGSGAGFPCTGDALSTLISSLGAAGAGSTGIGVTLEKSTDFGGSGTFGRNSSGMISPPSRSRARSAGVRPVSSGRGGCFTGRGRPICGMGCGDGRSGGGGGSDGMSGSGMALFLLPFRDDGLDPLRRGLEIREGLLGGGEVRLLVDDDLGKARMEDGHILQVLLHAVGGGRSGKRLVGPDGHHLLGRGRGCGGLPGAGRCRGGCRWLGQRSPPILE